MRPLLGPGVRVDIRPLDTPPRRGAILVYSASDRIVIHRLMRVLRDSGGVRFVTKGDASATEDPPIDPSCVLGEVTVVRYRRFSLRVDTRVWRRLGCALLRAAPLAHRVAGWSRKIY